jgi:hypothetical protein
MTRPIYGRLAKAGAEAAESITVFAIRFLGKSRNAS